MNNIDKVLLDYFFDYGDALEGLLFTNESPAEEITGIIVTDDTIEFCQDGDAIVTITKDEIENVYVGTNYVDKNNNYSNKVVFELKGYNIIRLFIDLNFKMVLHK